MNHNAIRGQLPQAIRRRSAAACLYTAALGMSATSLFAQASTHDHAVALRLLDFQGDPIHSARVQLVRAVPDVKRYLLVPGQAERVLSPADFKDGWARIEGLPEGEYVLRVDADLHAPTCSDEFKPSANTPPRVSVRLSHGATLPGKVASPDGKPLLGATVRLVARERVLNQHPFMVAMVSQFWAETTTATSAPTQQDGVYRFEHVAPGDYRVIAEHFACAATHADVVVGKDKPREVAMIKMRDGASLSGLVRKTGKPVAGAEVALWSLPIPAKDGGIEVIALRLTTRTDAEGRYVLPRVPFGTYMVAAHAGSQLIEQAQAAAATTRKVELRAEQTAAERVADLAVPER